MEVAWLFDTLNWIANNAVEVAALASKSAFIVGDIGGALGKDSDPPPAPDYTGAAAATAAGNADAARIAAKANRVSQYTPYGNMVYTPGVNGDRDQWRMDISLAPEQKALLDRQNKISLGLGNTMDQGLGYVQNMLDTPLDTSGFTQVDPASVAGREQVTAALLDRMQPGLDRKRQLSENALMIQGHNRGGEAWNANQDDLARAENDARLAAINAGGAEQSRLLGLQQAQRQNQLAETQTLRNEPLNTLNAVRTGAQVTNPSFTNVPQQQTVAGPNMLGAAQAQGQWDMNAYNAQQAASAGMMGGLFSLGGAALMSPAGTFTGPSGLVATMSDRRLKRNIKRIGTHRLGIGMYSWTYAWGGNSVGVMADEVESVMPEAVVMHPSGYKAVYYDMIK